MSINPPIKLTAHKAADLRQAIRKLTELEPALAALERCTDDCSDLREFKTETERRIQLLLEEFG